jgi:hypothetical protein
LRMTQVMIFVLLIGSYVVAEDAPNEVTPTAAYRADSSPLAALPATPKPQRVIDKKFILIMGTLGLAESMHITTRTLVLEHEQAAGAPWVTSLPSRPHLIAQDALIYVSELLVAYEMKKPHSWLPGDKVIRKLWWVYPAVMAAPHFKSAANNIQMKPPAGCASAECQAP